MGSCYAKKQLKINILMDEEVKRLERRFGPGVRLMGPWISDGTFGYCSVAMIAIEKAVEILDSPELMEAFSRLQDTLERTEAFIELLGAFGPALIDRIVAAHRQCSRELLAATV
jgi:hypothetical protein